MVSLPNPKTRVRDDLIITACGPLVNLLIAFVVSIVAGLLFRFGSEDLAKLCTKVIQVNVMLIVFNMLPIPPLDGSHFFRRAIGMSDDTYMRCSNWGIFILLVAMNIRPFQEFMEVAIDMATVPFAFIVNGIIAA